VSHTSAALRKTDVGLAVLRHGGAPLQAAMSAGQVHQLSSAMPTPAARAALLSAYRVGFSTTLNHLMDIGAVVAFVGAVCAFALVRQRDFVVPTASGGAPGPGGPPTGTETGPAAPEDAGVPAAHA
jgi:hypothetical protein